MRIGAHFAIMIAVAAVWGGCVLIVLPGSLGSVVAFSGCALIGVAFGYAATYL